VELDWSQSGRKACSGLSAICDALVRRLGAQRARTTSFFVQAWVPWQ
jgi:hypothetical protein